ncbi:MAG: DUF1653 domain-containing protein [Alphaproteobacteria bacterium]|nr:DUF1653 domain-containing protein [Alphaproteobacteria bacterium]
MEDVVLWGRYLHYKGHDCVVIGSAFHSETLEEFVIYTHDGKLWARPKNMFLETVEYKGQTVPRFKFIESKGDMPTKN